MEPQVILLILCAAAIIGFLVWKSIVDERKRREALRAWCAEGGWQFDEAEHGAPKLAYELFDRGHSRSARYFAAKDLEATPGLDAATVRLFQYHYAITSGSGKSRSTRHYYFVCAHVRPACDLGRVRIDHEGLGDKLIQAVGFDDIDFEDHEFSGRYKVHAKDRQHAYDLIDGSMMRYLNHAAAPAIETNGAEMLAYFPASASAGYYSAMVAFVEGFLTQLPRTLVNAERSRIGKDVLLEAGNAAPSSKEWLARLERNRKPW